MILPSLLPEQNLKSVTPERYFFRCPILWRHSLAIRTLEA